MASLADRVFDDGLGVFNAEATRLDICSQEPTDYTEATSTYTLGNKAGISVSTPADRAGGGREVTASAIADGSVTGTDTATHYAISDTNNLRLLATGSLSNPQAVTSGNTFTLTEFTIGIPDPA